MELHHLRAAWVLRMWDEASAFAPRIIHRMDTLIDLSKPTRNAALCLFF